MFLPPVLGPPINAWSRIWFKSPFVFLWTCSVFAFFFFPFSVHVCRWVSISNPLNMRECKRQLVSANGEHVVAFNPVEATPKRNWASCSPRPTIRYISCEEVPQLGLMCGNQYYEYFNFSGCNEQNSLELVPKWYFIGLITTRLSKWVAKEMINSMSMPRR